MAAFEGTRFEIADDLLTRLREDVVLSMPPELATITGRAQVTRFFATVPADGRLDTIRLVRTAANGHLALAAYHLDRKRLLFGERAGVFRFREV